MPNPHDSIREALAGHLVLRHFPRDFVLWQQGGRTGRLVLLERGQVRISRSVQGGREIPIFMFGPGDLFGFMPLLDGSPYPATAACAEEVTAHTLSQEGLERVLAHHPKVTRLLLSALSRRLRGAMDQLELLSMRGARQRAAAALASLVPADAPEPVLVELPVQARELAEALNLTPSTLSRALAELDELGAIHKLGAARYQVVDRALLEAQSQRHGLPLGSVL